MKKLILTLAVLAVCAVALISYNNYKTNQKAKEQVAKDKRIDAVVDEMMRYEDSLALDLERFEDSLFNANN